MESVATANDYQQDLANQRRTENAESRRAKHSYSPKKIPSLKDVKNLSGLKSHPFWLIAFACGIGSDASDTFPVAGWVISIFTRPPVMVFLIFCPGASWLRKVIWILVLFVDYVPIIGILPGTTGCLYDAYGIYLAHIQSKKEN